jgi:hypothetical protein
MRSLASVAKKMMKEKSPKKCDRCGARFKEDPSCGKIVHLFLPSKGGKK